MAICVNASGTWRNISTSGLCIRQSYVWRRVSACINHSGTWRAVLTKTTPASLGAAYQGGRLICLCGGHCAWIAALSTTEVSRTFYCRANSNTTAQAASGCTGWFVPNTSQAQNPGYCCRAYWDSYTATNYWTDSAYSFNIPYYINMSTGAVSGESYDPLRGCRNCVCRVRSFRTVTY